MPQLLELFLNSQENLNLDPKIHIRNWSEGA